MPAGIITFVVDVGIPEHQLLASFHALLKAPIHTPAVPVITVAEKVAVLEQPFPSITVTVYVPEAAGVRLVRVGF